MNKLSRVGTMIGTSIIALGALQSCVDNDYDLDKDMNLVVNVGGGQLSIPGSSTEQFSLKKLLDLDPESSIQPADEATAEMYKLKEGDYVLIQEGDPSTGDFEIDKVNLNVNGTHQNNHVEFPEFTAQVAGLIDRLSIHIGGQGDGLWNQEMPAFNNDITLSESNVNHDIVKISHVETDINLEATVKFTATDYNGSVHVAPGFKIQFGSIVNDKPEFEISLNNAIPECNVIDGHIIEFTRDYEIPAGGLPLNIHISGINCDDALNPETHNFDFASSIVTTGEIYINAPAVGAKVKMDITVTIGDPNGGTITGDIVAVTGVVNPTINIDQVTFNINDIPDFLKEDSYLDIANPQIYLTITNTSAASVNVDIDLTGSWNTGIYPDGNEPVVTQHLTITPGDNNICICRKSDGVADGYTAYENNNISALISKIPNSINVDIDASVEQKQTRFELGTNYRFTATNKVVAPLAFGNQLSFTYSDTEDGWDSDLGKYDFNEARIEMEVANTAPLNFILDVDPIFIDNNSRPVVVTILENNNTIFAGTKENPAISKVIISIKGNGNSFTSSNSTSSLKGLDGIKYSLRTNNSNEVAGIPINAEQGMTFSQIRARLIGGVTLDLNEM